MPKRDPNRDLPQQPGASRAPGTSFVSRLLSKRFGIVDPKSAGEVHRDVTPVYVVGEVDDRIGLGCRAVHVVASAVAVAARNSFLGIEVYPASTFEYVLRAIRVRATAGGQLNFDLFGRSQGSMSGGATQALLYAEGGLATNTVPIANALLQNFDAAGPPPQNGLDEISLVAGAGNEVYREFPSGIIIRQQTAIQLMCQTQNVGFFATFYLTERPLSA